jgi:hypothetical protein
MAKQDISKEQFIQICTEYGFEVRELNEPWKTDGVWYVAFIPNYNSAIAGHIPEDHETNVCVKLDCFYDGPDYFLTRTICQPADVQKFKFFLGEVNKTVKNHIVNMKLKMQEEDFQ